MWKCPNCATENSDWVKKCEKCQYKPEREKVSASQVLKTSAIVALVLACVVALTVFFGVKQNTGKDSGEVVYVEINDPGIEKAVRVTLNKPEGQLTQEELHLHHGGTEYFVCGPEQFMLDMAGYLKSQGVPASRIKIEVFSTGDLAFRHA